MSLAITLRAPGGADALEVTDITVAEPGDGEVRIRQSTIGVNFVDIYYRQGLYPMPAGQNIIGLEGAGVVEAIAPGVTEFRVGDRVAYTGHPLGGYAELRNIPASRLVAIPDGVSERAAGSSMLRGLTAHMLLTKIHPLEKGDWVLVHAAAGGLGQLVTRWATRLGGRVIGTVGSQVKAEIALKAGAEAVLLHSDGNWADEAKRIADGKGVHLAVDGIGGAMLSQTLGTVRPFGVAASLGQPAGPIPPVRMEELGAPRVIGMARPSVLAYANDPRLYRKGAADLFAALQAGLTNPIGAEYPLRDAGKAQAALEAGQTTGSVILTI